MKIVDEKVIEILCGVGGNSAIRLQECSYSLLDQGNAYQLINLKNTYSIDGLGIRVLENLLNRGINVRLFNVRPEIRKIIKMSGKEDKFVFYNVNNIHEAMAMYEKELLEESIVHDMKRRNNPRVDVSIRASFKYCQHQVGILIGSATILNLSEGGILINLISSFDINCGVKVVNKHEIVGKELCDMSFILSGSSSHIGTNGKCIWQTGEHKNLYAGICFKDMEKNKIEMIRDYVIEQSCN